ncbi:probable G-protein coupled receptor 83 [Trichonephila inaurata madagascariensis]|uniref:Probable G-protein coupled receptor 83 n=1 Tax=Trichonephila inaurata madagascariensis TaxID=2747483 RepID=A0A8X6WVM0_9ARAC|nr:probable G-protein coupled receptor 83 [Trichonephila inaurata madagascariensis]
MNSTIEPLNVTDVFRLLMTWKNRSQNWSSTLKGIPSVKDQAHVIIIFYSLIILISIFGNLLVCNIVAQNRKMRSSTYVFIANLALSDFLTTVLNIPFNIARILFDHWPFGSFMCSFVPLVQVTSVYVSTFTMTCIAVDRYRIISKPLEPRLRSVQAIKIIVCVWILALVLSLPHAIFNRVETIFTFRHLTRCRAVYPPGTSRWITLIAVFTQYVFPLTVTGVLYYLIIIKVWSRNSLGVVTEGQRFSQEKAKKKTIKMLVVVVILFALCWLPLNIFNLLREFNLSQGFHRSVSHSTVFFICHWLAMSSVCYNPFIYCWLNDNFRAGALNCLLCMKNAGRQLNDGAKSVRFSRHSSVPTTTAVSLDYGIDSNQESLNDSCCSNAVYLSDKKSNLERRKSSRRHKSNELEVPTTSSVKKEYCNVAQLTIPKKNPFSKHNSEVTTTLVNVELRDLKSTKNEKVTST